MWGKCLWRIVILSKHGLNIFQFQAPLPQPVRPSPVFPHRVPESAQETVQGMGLGSARWKDRGWRMNACVNTNNIIYYVNTHHIVKWYILTLHKISGSSGIIVQNLFSPISTPPNGPTSESNHFILNRTGGLLCFPVETWNLDIQQSNINFNAITSKYVLSQIDS